MTSTLVRKIVRIDESKCDGCGLCVPACHEGAIAIVDGKARLIGEVYCDGLSDCLGECPRDAITIEEREAEAYDSAAVASLLERKDNGAQRPPVAPHGCPGAAAATLRPTAPAPAGEAGSPPSPSQLTNWPVQLHLVSPGAPYLRGAPLLIAADCVPFAYADFHRKVLQGRICLIGCPKLDDGQAYVEKLAAIFTANDTPSADIAYMEVSCCHGLVRIVEQAIALSGKIVPLSLIEIGVRGDIC